MDSRLPGNDSRDVPGIRWNALVMCLRVGWAERSEAQQFLLFFIDGLLGFAAFSPTYIDGPTPSIKEALI